MSRFWDFIKEHRWLTAGAILTVGVIFIIVFRKPGQSAAPPDNTLAALAAAQQNNVASGNQLQAAQLQAGVASNAVGAGLAASETATAADVTKTQIAADNSVTIASIAAQIQQAVIAASTHNADQTAAQNVAISTLAAQVQGAMSYDARAASDYTTLAASNVANTQNTYAFLNSVTSPMIAAAATNGAPLSGSSGGVNFSYNPAGQLSALNYGVENTEFATTTPTASQQIAALYQGYLGRAPDAAGLNYYLADLTAGREDLGGIATSIMASPEYQSKLVH